MRRLKQSDLSDSDEVMFSLEVSELGLKPVISPLHQVHLKLKCIKIKFLKFCYLDGTKKFYKAKVPN